MKNMDNNMDDFFKKNFNRFDEPFDDWEKPDAGDWEAIASQVPMFSRTSFWTLSNIGLMTLSAILVSSLIYVWVLKKEISVLEKTVEVQQEQIERVEQSVQVIEKQYIKKQAIVETEKQEFEQQLEQQNQAIINQNQILNTIAKKQKEVIAELSMTLDNPNYSKVSNSILNKTAENNIPLANEVTKTGAETTETTDKIINTNLENTGKLSLAKAENEVGNTTIKSKNTIIAKAENVENEEVIISELLRLSSSRFSVINQNSPIFDPNLLVLNNEKDLKKRKRPIIKLPNVNLNGVEVGYEYRMQMMEIPSTLDIAELETKSKGHWGSESFVGLHGITLGIPLKKNWSMQTGLRISNHGLYFKEGATSTYNSADEFTLPNGSIAKGLNVLQETPFSTLNTSVQLVFDVNDRLMDNEDFDWKVHGQQDQKMVQIPLGINYEIGIRRWSLVAGLGVQWNRIELGDVAYRIDFDDHNRTFQTLTSDIDVLSRINDLNYFSTFATTGLQYQFTQKWSAQATVGYNYHFFNNQSIEKWENSDKSVTVGLKYGF